MDHALELPHDVDALRVLVVTQRHLLTERHAAIALRDDTIVACKATIAQREQHNRLLVKLVFGKSSEQRLSEPFDPALQGNLFLAEIAAEAQRLAEQHAVVATVEVPAHTRTQKKRRGEFPAHLPVVRTVCELKGQDRVCACGGELKAFGEETSRELERIETAIVHEIARKKYACATCQEGVVTAPWRGKVIDKGLLSRCKRCRRPQVAGLSYRAFDVCNSDRYFAHTMASCCLTVTDSMTLAIRLKATGAQTTTDVIYLGVDGHMPWGMLMSTLQEVRTGGADESWSRNEVATFVLDLRTLPASDVHPRYGLNYPAGVTSILEEVRQAGAVELSSLTIRASITSNSSAIALRRCGDRLGEW